MSKNGEVTVTRTNIVSHLTCFSPKWHYLVRLEQYMNGDRIHTDYSASINL